MRLTGTGTGTEPGCSVSVDKNRDNIGRADGVSLWS